MKKIVFLLLCCCLVWSCNKNDDDSNTNNQFLPNYTFDTGTLINLSLPQYSDLQFANNYVILNSNYGINGVVVFYAGGNNYNAFELSDPNHALRTCSTLTVEGVIASCDCEDHDKRYDILTGQPQEGTSGSYGLKRYFVQRNGDIIRVWNN
jgi:nitrite reductase/ring-hydroxylating ferredoxin subunit